MKVKCLLVSLLVILAAGQLMADQIIFAPTGTTLGLGQAKVEGAVSSDDSDQNYVWANVGLTKVELQAIRVGTASGDNGTGFGAELSVLPETIVTPAVGLGVRDVADDTDLGRAFYLAVTKTVPLTGWTGVTIKLTGGAGTDAIDGLFGGVVVGLPQNLTAYGEFDGENVNWALGWNPVKYVQLKGYWLDGDFYYGGRLSFGL